jgi:lipopolysaccharide transport system ATP-binding protein
MNEARGQTENELILCRGLSKQFPTGGSQTVAQVLRGMRFRPPPFVALRDLDFTLYQGECVAIFGGNGSGKSTFLRCLAGVIEPNRGEILRIGKLAALLSHGFGAYEELPVWRNILLVQQLLGLTQSEARANLAKVAEFAGLSDRMWGPTSQLSEGMRAKISLSSLAFTPFDFALLDESLNHVDSEFRARFYNLTRQWIKLGRSLMITSHDEHLLENFATRRLWMMNNSLTATPPKE